MQANTNTLLNAMLQGIATMGIGRKGKFIQVSIRPPTTVTLPPGMKNWRNKKITALIDRHCICRACEGDFKRRDRFRWMTGVKTGPGSRRFIVASCTENDCIIHTGFATKDKIADFFHNQVRSDLLTPLCVSHYGHIYYMIICTQTKDVMHSFLVEHNTAQAPLLLTLWGRIYARYVIDVINLWT